MPNTIIINASPRKGWNTAQLLKEAKKGAESTGADVEYADLYDLSFTGCHSCLACKAEGSYKNKCFWEDDLSPLIDRILRSDSVIIGTPIYFGEPTSGFRALIERLLFCVLSYEVDGDGSYYDGSLNVGIIYTMNAPRAYYESTLRNSLEHTEGIIKMLLKGSVMTYGSCNTLQVDDYRKYRMSIFSETAKKSYHDNQFPIDMQEAYKLGFEISSATQ